MALGGIESLVRSCHRTNHRQRHRVAAFAGDTAAPPRCLRGADGRDILVVAGGTGGGEEVNCAIHVAWRCRCVESMTDLAGTCRSNILEGRRPVKPGSAVQMSRMSVGRQCVVRSIVATAASACRDSGPIRNGNRRTA